MVNYVTIFDPKWLSVIKKFYDVWLYKHMLKVVWFVLVILERAMRALIPYFPKTPLFRPEWAEFDITGMQKYWMLWCFKGKLLKMAPSENSRLNTVFVCIGYTHFILIWESALQYVVAPSIIYGFIWWYTHVNQILVCVIMYG